MAREQREQRTIRLRLSDLQFEALIAALEASPGDRPEAIIARVQKAWHAAGVRKKGWAGYRNPNNRRS